MDVRRSRNSLELIFSNDLSSTEVVGTGTGFSTGFGFSSGLLAAFGFSAGFDDCAAAFGMEGPLDIMKNSRVSNSVFLFQLVGVCPMFWSSFRSWAEDIVWYFDISPTAGTLLATG